MPAPPSKLVIGTVEEASPKAGGIFLPFGDRDDPQRLVVLLAEHVAKQLPSDPSIKRWADTCLDPKASWRERQAALGRALARAAERQTSHFMTLVDIDALAPKGDGAWAAHPSAEMRKGLYGVLLGAIERGGWAVVRPCPSRSVSAELEALGIAGEYAPELAGAMRLEEANPLAPEVRPVAAWLVRRGVLRPRDLSRIIADVAEFDEYVVDRAYEALPPAARDAGKLLSVVRPPQHVNGALGPFAYADGPPSATSVPRAAADALRAAGFLQPGAEPSTLRMPRLVRDLLRRFTPLGMGAEVRRLHQRLAAETLETEDVSAQLEIHHHAVSAGDIERAKSTARFYGTELRDLATELSLEAHREGSRAKFAKAAELFDYVVKNFDQADAYSWEYLGYNLARADAAANARRVLEAYQRAYQISNKPLYHGRLLGFRGQMGHDVCAEFVRWFDRYVAAKSGDEAVSLFAKATLEGLQRGQQHEQVAQIVGQRRALLERFAPRALEALRAAPLALELDRAAPGYHDPTGVPQATAAPPAGAPGGEGGPAPAPAADEYNARPEPPQAGLGESLTTIQADIEERVRDLWGIAPTDRASLRREIDRLRAKAATIIRAKADASLGPLERAHEGAVAEARRLLGR